LIISFDKYTVHSYKRPARNWLRRSEHKHIMPSSCLRIIASDKNMIPRVDRI